MRCQSPMVSSWVSGSKVGEACGAKSQGLHSRPFGGCCGHLGGLTAYEGAFVRRDIGESKMSTAFATGSIEPNTEVPSRDELIARARALVPLLRERADEDES